jgi:hypothetical protein
VRETALYGGEMEAAVFGLVGVVLGGLLTAGTQLWLEHRRERRAISRAKRLVSGELLHAILILRTEADRSDGTWMFFDDAARVLPTTAWGEHRAHLAELVSEEVWERLVMAYAMLEIDRGRLQRSDALPPTAPMSDDTIAGLRQTVVELTVLREALGAGDWS